MKKRTPLIPLLLALVLALLLPTTALAADAASLDDSDMVLYASSDSIPADASLLGQVAAAYDGSAVTDLAGLLSAGEIETLNEKLAAVRGSYGITAAVVTVDSMNDYFYAQDAADDIYDYIINADGDRPDGILFFITMGERKWHISTVGAGIRIFTDAGLEYMEDNFIDDLRDGDYYGAFDAYASLCASFSAQAASGAPYDADNLPKTPMSPVWFAVAVGIGLLIGTLIMTYYKSQLKTVRMQQSAHNYIRNGSMAITGSRDVFLYSHVNRVAKPKESGSPGGSGTHSGSSGASHGGRGGSF
ncbi:MAG: TPM domain-containing protein [Clostridia bacterium]|nr:TPM domain-containing protein [Clostridia bacterium]